MKLTKSQLREIIKEELNDINEDNSISDGDKRKLLSKLDGAYKDMKQSIQEGRVGSGDLVIRKEVFRTNGGNGYNYKIGMSAWYNKR